jgi:hypothetical protein
MITNGRPFRVVCLDNCGFDGILVRGKEYDAKAHPKYPDLIVVTHDGKEQEFFGWRFRIVEQGGN